MNNKTRTLSQCCFANVRLPLNFKSDGDENGASLITKDSGKITALLRLTALDELIPYLQTALHGTPMWVRPSAQIYLGVDDFEWVRYKLKELCGRLNENPGLIG